MKNLLIVVTVLLFGCSGNEAPTTDPSVTEPTTDPSVTELTISPSVAAHLPAHTVAGNTALPNGLRIQIDVNDPNISKEDCKNLILAYKEMAAPDGQVSVRKPSERGGRELLPWCIENFGSGEIRFLEW
jgi:hypothetical protein